MLSIMTPAQQFAILRRGLEEGLNPADNAALNLESALNALQPIKSCHALGYALQNREGAAAAAGAELLKGDDLHVRVELEAWMQEVLDPKHYSDKAAAQRLREFKAAPRPELLAEIERLEEELAALWPADAQEYWHPVGDDVRSLQSLIQYLWGRQSEDTRALGRVAAEQLLAPVQAEYSAAKQRAEALRGRMNTEFWAEDSDFYRYWDEPAKRRTGEEALFNEMHAAEQLERELAIKVRPYQERLQRIQAI